MKIAAFALNHKSDTIYIIETQIGGRIVERFDTNCGMAALVSALDSLSAKDETGTLKVAVTTCTADGQNTVILEPCADATAKGPEGMQ